MKKFLLLDHYAHHDSFAYPKGKTSAQFREDGQIELLSLQRFFVGDIVWDTVEVEKQTDADWSEIFARLSEYDGVFLSGSPFSVNDEHTWLSEEKNFLHKALKKKNIPFFGICFGHQLLAKILGGDVAPHSRYIEEKISFQLGEKKLSSFAHHGEYISQLPLQSKVIARGENNMPYFVQHSPKNSKIFGVQVHIEQKTEDAFSEQYWRKFFSETF